MENKNSSAYNVALFRYKTITDLLSKNLNEGEVWPLLKIKSQEEYYVPWENICKKFSERTLWRWYVLAKYSEDPVRALLPKERNDVGRRKVITKRISDWLHENYKKWEKWSYKLHYDNLKAAKIEEKSPSYTSVRRFMKMNKLIPQIFISTHRRFYKDIRSYEVEFVGELWHMDFHHGSRNVLLPTGEWKKPLCCCIIDDKSRLVCHIHWSLYETAETLVECLIHAILKRGLPRNFYSDCGAAMRCHEFVTGLEVLGIQQQRTQPYSPYMNGKQEVFWGSLEGRLLKMLPENKALTLENLNHFTKAWLEQDYHIQIHSETKETPLNRFLNCGHVLRNSPSYTELKKCFARRIRRKQRGTDHSISLSGVRFQIPQYYWHINILSVRFTKWNLTYAEILDERTLKAVTEIYPIDKENNSLGQRKHIENEAIIKSKVTVKKDRCATPSEILEINDPEIPPLLQQCLEDYRELVYGS